MPKTFRISEIFGGVDATASVPVIQGEGKHVGMPSIFIRMFGCNLRCPGFGQSQYVPGSTNAEVQVIIQHLVDYKCLADLPTVKTGCDSYYAIYPEFKTFSRYYTVDQLVEEIKTRSQTKFKPPHVIFTGGEPVLWQAGLVDVLEELNKDHKRNITFETNGTVELTKNTISVVNATQHQYTWSVSPKLSNSGHSKFQTFNSTALRSFNQVTNSTLYLKFVVDINSDINEVIEMIKSYSYDGVDIEDVYLMPEGSNLSNNYLENRNRVISWCTEFGFKYSPRLQVELFNNCIGS